MPFRFARMCVLLGIVFCEGKLIRIRYNLRSLMVRRVQRDDRVSGRAGGDDPFHPVGIRRGPARHRYEKALSDNWIVLSRGTTDEGGSYITRDQYEIIKSRRRSPRLQQGEALVSPEVITGFNRGGDIARRNRLWHVPSRRLSGREPGAQPDAHRVADVGCTTALRNDRRSQAGRALSQFGDRKRFQIRPPHFQNRRRLLRSRTARASRK